MAWGDKRLDRLNNFIAYDPLYARLDLAQLFDGQDYGSAHNALNMTKIFRWCPDHRCRTERPYDRVDEPYADVGFHQEPGGTEATPKVYSLLLRCSGCGSDFRCWIEVPVDDISNEQKIIRIIRKVGQLPPYDISISRSLEDTLGEDALLYKRALICVSQSFGVGACTYLRRILENQSSPLLRTVYDNRRDDGASDEDLKAVSKIMEKGSAEERIKLANEVLPQALRIAGENPLELIYDKLSAGLHRQDEQQCTAVASEVREALEHVFVGLSVERQQRQGRNRYAEIVRDLRERPADSSDTQPEAV